MVLDLPLCSLAVALGEDCKSEAAMCVEQAEPQTPVLWAEPFDSYVGELFKIRLDSYLWAGLFVAFVGPSWRFQPKMRPQVEILIVTSIYKFSL